MQRSTLRTTYRPPRSRRFFALYLAWALIFSALTGYAAMTLSAFSQETARAQEMLAVKETAAVVTKPAEKPQSQTEKPAATAAAQTPAPVVSAPAPQPAPAPAPAPVYDTVSIPGVGLSARYVTVGLTAQGAVDVHPTLAGWWNGSAQIGQPGAAFLDGHNPGVFSALPNVRNGAQITIKKANGELFNYTVVHTETVKLEEVNMRKALRPYSGSEGLNLMTCVGAYNPSKGTTDYRFIVYAVRS